MRNKPRGGKDVKLLKSILSWRDYNLSENQCFSIFLGNGWACFFVILVYTLFLNPKPSNPMITLILLAALSKLLYEMRRQS